MNIRVKSQSKLKLEKFTISKLDHLQYFQGGVHFDNMPSPPRTPVNTSPPPLTVRTDKKPPIDTTTSDTTIGGGSPSGANTNQPTRYLAPGKLRF